MSQSIISEETYLLDNENPALKETVPPKKKKIYGNIMIVVVWNLWLWLTEYKWTTNSKVVLELFHTKLHTIHV